MIHNAQRAVACACSIIMFLMFTAAMVLLAAFISITITN